MPPTARLAVPFTIARGTTSRVIVRGQTLDQINTVEACAGVTATIIEKGEAKLPEGWKAEQLGDRQITLDVAVAEAFVRDTVKLVLSGDSKTTSIGLAIVSPEVLVVEKEPNRGFKGAQLLTIGSTVLGSIGSNKDVDVYRIDQGATGRLHIDVTASRCGSSLDPILTVYDARGFEIARCDDSPATAPHDAAITIETPSGKRGVRYIVIQDAHDTGSDTHLYELRVTDSVVDPKKSAAVDDFVAKFHVAQLETATDYRYQIEELSPSGELETLASGDDLKFRTVDVSRKSKVTAVMISCVKKDTVRVWEEISKLSPDLLCLSGDTLYIDTIELEDFRRKHRDFLNEAPLANLARPVSVVGIWDDHDFELNSSPNHWPRQEVNW